MSKLYEATLVRGQTYYLGNKRFERGRPETVTAEEKAKLEANGVDRATVIAGDEKSVSILPKFKFKALAKDAKLDNKSERLAGLAALADAKGDVDFEDDEDALEEGDESAEEYDEGSEDSGDFLSEDDEEADPEPPAPKKAAAKKPAARNRTR